MRWQLRPLQRREEWHRWFAWRPANIEGTNTFVWLETVERQLRHFYTGSDWFYREVGSA